MADTIKLPGIGETKKRTVYIAGGVLVVAVGVYYWRNRGSTAATDTTGTTDTTSMSDQIDPATGYVYGSAEDQSALIGQQQYGAVGSGGGTSGGSVLPETPTGFTNNAQWSDSVEDYLANTVGMDATTVQAALGKYITGGQATAAQEAIIDQGIAHAGYPPVSGVNGYPPSIRTAPATSPPPTASKPTPKLATPHIYVEKTGKTGDLDVHWNPVAHAGFYLVSGSHGGQYKVSATQHPNFLLKAGSSMHVTAYPTGYSNTGQRVKYVPYLASSPSNTLTARKR